MEKKLVQEFPTLELYFHELVNDALKHQQIKADEHIAFYLVNLLSQFTKTEKFRTDEEGVPTPLAVLFCKALRETPTTKAQLLKYLGDFSLFISGFFQESLNRKLVDLDYYVTMGEGAYHHLSSLTVFQKKQTFQQIFSELASRFVQWVDVITEVSETSQITTHRDLLRLYEKWLRTGSQRLHEMLTQQGIFPDGSLNTEFRH
jgi:hypothetical protein